MEGPCKVAWPILADSPKLGRIGIPSIFINNLRGDKYSVIWCLFDPGKTKNSYCFPQGKQKPPIGISPGVFCFPGS